MKPFLYDIAQQIYAAHPKLDEVTLVFPNRRAVIYFRKHLTSILSKPSFAPRLLTIEDFIGNFSSYKIPDKLELVYRLYQSYTKTVNSQEAFDQFYFWGDMLLRDFNEIDKYLVNASLLFKDLSNQKKLDANFDYLTEEQKTFLLDFWGNFDEHKTKNKQKFLEVWMHLGDAYTHYRKALKTENLAYEGMVQREVAENVKNYLPGESDLTKTIFVGFNALTKAEERILSYCVEQGSEVHWDVDEYYVNNGTQEAGNFFREYQEHSVLGKTFDKSTPANFRNPKSIKVFGQRSPDLVHGCGLILEVERGGPRGDVKIRYSR